MNLGGDWLLLIDAPVWLVLLPGLVGLEWVLRLRGRRLGAGRLGLMALLLLALARPVLRTPTATASLLLADRSASVVGGELDAVLDSLAPGSGLVVMPWGDGAASPLGEAIDRSRFALPGARRLLVLSDGLDTGGGALAAAERAAASSQPIDVLLLPAVAQGPDAALVALDVPQALRAGVAGDLAVTIRSNLSATMRIELSAAGERLAAREVELAAGEHVTWLPIRVPAEIGPWVLDAQVILAEDTRPANDRLSSVVEVLPPPELLVIGEGAEPVRLADALGAAGGFKTTVLGPRRLPGRLSALERWPVMVLVDVPAAALAHEQRALLEAAVADSGQGLLMMGGRSSFALGGWRATPLEFLAPVRLEPAPSGRRREVALLLMVDRSASMAGGDSRSRASKLDLAREAGLLAAEALAPEDRIGALAYDDEARWLSALAPVGLPGERREFRRALAQVTPGGGTRILAALELGLPALAAETAATRHAVLLSDGRDDQLQEEQMAEAVRQARASGVTMSVIAIGLDADTAVLQRLARLGGGRYHAARDPGDLPRLTAQESQMVRAGAEREGNVRVRLSGPGGRHPVLSGIDLAALPPLAGYQALLPRPDADVLLESEDGDPILSTWRYGHGQVAAWTADAGAAWARKWLESPEGTAAWGQALHQLAPAVSEARLVVEAELEADGRSAVVTARLASRDGQSQSLADVSLRFTDPGASDDPLVLPEVSPGIYRRAITLGDPTNGPLLWRGTVTAVVDGPRQESSEAQTREDVLQAPLRIARGHAVETLPNTGGEDLLVEIARRSGGRVLDTLPEPWRLAPEPDRPLWPWLLGLVVLAWPLDLASRLSRAPRGPRTAIRASTDPDIEGAQP